MKMHKVQAMEVAGKRIYKSYKSWKIRFFIRFSWESAFTGVEAAHEARNHDREHITADVGSAVRAIFFATHDLNWMKDYGCDLAIETARFWASRVAFNQSANCFDINGVVEPDEGHSTVNNNPFTNAAAALNLYFGTSVSIFMLSLVEWNFEILFFH